MIVEIEINVAGGDWNEINKILSAIQQDLGSEDNVKVKVSNVQYVSKQIQDTEYRSH